MQLDTAHGSLPLPAFLPDATRGAVRATELEAVRGVGVRALMINAFHLVQRPGADRIRRLGGLHRFTGWDGPLVTDSGGFQAWSLIRENPKHGAVTHDGIHYRAPGSGKKLKLTPEKSIQTQLALGADVIIALDECTHPDDPPDVQQQSVERTIRWGRQARAELDRQIEQRGLREPPLLVGVVQGGASAELRRECAEALVETGFDGFGFGGWPVDSEGVLQHESFALLERLLPPETPRFALGVGKPEHVVAVAGLGGGYVFDCTLPTRDARHRRLYVYERAPGPDLPADESFYRRLYITDEAHAGDPGPLEDGCDCPCCARYSRAYLHHLFKVDDPGALALATLHNLRFYTRLVAALAAGEGGA